MAQTVKLKRSATPAKVPATTDLALGELAINTYDGKLYLKKDNGSASIVEVGAGGSMTYPGAGIPNSTGSAWGTSYTTTGSGTVVALATSPAFVTPVLGTPTSGTLTNCTGLPVGGISASGSASSSTYLRGDGAWSSVTASATGGGTDKIFWCNDQTVTTNYSVPAGQNAGSFGPITVNNGITVTVPSGSTWTVV